MKIRIKKLHESAKMPVRAHATDAGMDLFYCPRKDRLSKEIAPGESVLLPTGLKIEVPNGYMLEIKNKGGIAAKKSLVVGSCVVDYGYNDDVFINLHNIGTETQTIDPGTKIAQGVFVKVNYDVELVESDEIYDEETSRGDGKLGSTGLK
jgi:dUTP pyrophosphatase